jgi:hypothetical protein
MGVQDGAFGAVTMGCEMLRRRVRPGHSQSAPLAVLALALVVLWAVLFVDDARAEKLASTCPQLTSRIATADSHPNHGEGDVIVLEGMCDASSLKTSAGIGLPAGANFAIEGAPGTTSGFDGAGVTASMLHSEGGETLGSIALRSLTFQHAKVTTFAGGALSLRVQHVTLAGDTFLENHVDGGLGGAVEVLVDAKPCPPAGAAPGVTVTGTTFIHNSVSSTGGSGGGGALRVGQECAFPGVVLEGNLFEYNTYFLGAAPGEAEGGAFMFEGGATVATPITQRGNVFDRNAILSPPIAARLGGGGEWLEGASLTSIGDRFTGNSITESTPGGWSWGGGLGILNTSCNPLTATESTLANAVIIANTTSGAGGDAAGAGAYIGCSPSTTAPNHLSLLDSTVTGNHVKNGRGAGVAGNPSDQLSIANSIVAADTGAAEIDGFAGPGGSLAATFSDVCAADGTTPLAGEGNICADPHLRAGTEALSVDPRETSLSPTVDAGSNALVPAGLTTDFLGGPRIVAGTLIAHCTGPTTGPATVDMGAAEGPAATRIYPLKIVCPHKVLFRLEPPTISVGAGGALTLTFRNVPAGRLHAAGRYARTRTVVRRIKGRRRAVKLHERPPYGSTSRTVAGGRTRLKLLPTRAALRALRRHGRLRVTLAFALASTGGRRATAAARVEVRYKPLRRGRHRR